MKTPRDINASELVKILSKIGYIKTRQTGSHIRLTKNYNNKEFHVTIPNHNPIKIGTLNSILNSIAIIEGKTKSELILRLFVTTHPLI
jgi:predicted RNA binding protein YcfA (HicA-like mRNA interferase family)